VQQNEHSAAEGGPLRQTLGNLASGGCLVVLPLLLLVAAGAAAAAAKVCWRDTGASARRTSDPAGDDL